MRLVDKGLQATVPGVGQLPQTEQAVIGKYSPAQPNTFFLMCFLKELFSIQESIKVHLTFEWLKRSMQTRACTYRALCLFWDGCFVSSYSRFAQEHSKLIANSIVVPTTEPHSVVVSH